MKTIPHRSLPVTLEVAVSALSLYITYGGPRRLHYFDSFHVAASLAENIPLLTSDRYILLHERDLGIETLDVRRL